MSITYAPINKESRIGISSGNPRGTRPAHDHFVLQGRPGPTREGRVGGASLVGLTLWVSAIVVAVGAEAAANLTRREYRRVHVRVRGTRPDRPPHLPEARRSGLDSLLWTGDDIGRREPARD